MKRGHDKVIGNQLSCEYKQFARGGSGNHMFAQSGVGPQAPGVSATTRHGKTGTMKRVTGGHGNHMAGKGRSKALRPA